MRRNWGLENQQSRRQKKNLDWNGIDLDEYEIVNQEGGSGYISTTYKKRDEAATETSEEIEDFGSADIGSDVDVVTRSYGGGVGSPRSDKMDDNGVDLTQYQRITDGPDGRARYITRPDVDLDGYEEIAYGGSSFGSDYTIYAKKTPDQKDDQ